MPRQHSDTSTEISIDFSRDPSSKGGRTSAQDDQLARARETALKNRRVKLRDKLETRLADLRRKLGDLGNDQLERVVRHLIETEDRHRSKLADMTDHMNKTLQYIHDELRAIRKGDSKSRASVGSSAVTLSDVSRSIAR